MWAALDRDSFALAITRARALLADNPVDPSGYAGTAYAAGALHDATTAEHHWWMATGLLQSIQRSGAGTEESPLVVITVDEEYEWARYNGMRPTGQQGLGDCLGRPCDSVGFTDPRTGQDTTVFFDVSIPYATLEKLFHK
jgi:hypothetical protein